MFLLAKTWQLFDSKQDFTDFQSNSEGNIRLIGIIRDLRNFSTLRAILKLSSLW